MDNGSSAKKMIRVEKHLVIIILIIVNYLRYRKL